MPKKTRAARSTEERLPFAGPPIAQWLSRHLGAEARVGERLHSRAEPRGEKKWNPGSYRRRLVAAAQLDEEITALISTDAEIRAAYLDALQDPRSLPYRANLWKGLFDVRELLSRPADLRGVSRLFGVASEISELTNTSQTGLIAAVLKRGGDVALFAPDTAANRGDFDALVSRVIDSAGKPNLSWIAGPPAFGLACMPLAIINPGQKGEQVFIGLPFTGGEGEVHAIVCPIGLRQRLATQCLSISERVRAAGGVMHDESGVWRLVRAAGDRSSQRARLDSLVEAAVDAAADVLQSRGARAGLSSERAALDAAVRTAVRAAVRKAVRDAGSP